jgi:hypothetical protein
VLYRTCSNLEAAPKGISGRTSYLLDRLAFHSYAQVIQIFFSRHWFGPPPPVTGVSACSGVALQVSSLARVIKVALFRLAFAVPSPIGLSEPHGSKSPAHASIGTPSPRHEGVGLRLLVGARFQVLFHSPPGVLFTVPSRYYSLSVTRNT